jgi:hypothetical protein
MMCGNWPATKTFPQETSWAPRSGRTSKKIQMTFEFWLFTKQIIDTHTYCCKEIFAQQKNSMCIGHIHSTTHMWFVFLPEFTCRVIHQAMKTHTLNSLWHVMLFINCSCFYRTNQHGSCNFFLIMASLPSVNSKHFIFSNQSRQSKNLKSSTWFWLKFVHPRLKISTWQDY